MDATAPERRDPLWVAAPPCLRDACFSLPAVRAVATIRAVTVVAPPTQAFLWDTVAAVEAMQVRYVAWEKSAMTELLRDCPAILLWQDGVAAKAAVAAKVGQRIGLPARGLRGRLTQCLERIVEPGPPQHRVQQFLETVKALGADPFQSQYFAALERPDRKQESLILLDLTSDFGSHYQWPPEYWSQLIEDWQLPRSRCRVVAGSDAVIRWAEEHELAQIDGADWDELLQAELYVGVENRRIHGLAAFGIRCAIIYGPGAPALHRPLGKQHVVIRRKAECAPCFADHCFMGDLRCQRELLPEYVWQSIEPLLAE